MNDLTRCLCRLLPRGPMLGLENGIFGGLEVLRFSQRHFFSGSDAARAESPG